MKKKKQDAVPLRVKMSTVISGIILAAVCSMEFIELPFENELWFGLTVIGILMGCLLLMWWSFGGFERKDEKYSGK